MFLSVAFDEARYRMNRIEHAACHTCFIKKNGIEKERKKCRNACIYKVNALLMTCNQNLVEWPR